MGRWVVRGLAWAFRSALTSLLDGQLPSFHVGPGHILKLPGRSKGAAIQAAKEAEGERRQAAGSHGLALLVCTPSSSARTPQVVWRAQCSGVALQGSPMH